MIPLRDRNSSGIFPFMTLMIISVNTLFLWLQFTASDPERFTHNLALVPNLINYDDISTLYPFITAMFLHGGLLHFLSNMWFLHIFGDNVEASLGRLRYLFFYISGGVIASLIELIFIENSQIPIVGASGAIAAVLGFYIIMFPHHSVTAILPIFPIFTAVNVPSFLVLGIWFLTQVISGTISLITASTSVSGIAWWAHIGGFIYGMQIALLFRLSNTKKYL